ncbi:hypothetical protein ACFSSA_11010 [Luteolibacter algae]|uniref:Uncharacterized protein n=1 Tax=Luteolibacter algae TaxID=454151 RepID=A0ABW5DAX8_9BACT
MQQPQEEARTAMALAEMANSKRIMVGFVYRGGFLLKRKLIANDLKNSRPFETI